MKKILVLLSAIALVSCGTPAPVEQVATTDSTVVAALAVDTTVVADSCAIDSVK